jgi:hypothetical protein
MAKIELTQMRSAAGCLALALGLGLPACSSSSNGAAPAEDGGSIGCTTDPRVETMMVNLTHKGDNAKINKPHLSFIITKADFIPPAAENNTWTLKILDASGQPVNDATITFPLLGHPSDPWMPDHGHPDAHAMATKNADGTFNISPLYFFMAGVWSTYIQAQVGSVTDSTTFTVCVGG